MKNYALKIINERFKTIEKTYENLCGKTKKGEKISSGAEWILDNFYIAQRQVKAAREENDKRAGGKLTLDNGKVVIYEELKDYFIKNNCEYDFDGLCGYMGEKAQTKNLSASELWLLPLFLRAVILEQLAFACGEMERNEPGGARRMGRIFKSLSESEKMDWEKGFYRVSPIEKIFSRDGAVYMKMEIESKNYYIKQNELLAKKINRGESETANAAFTLAEGKEGARGHFGYYIVDRGRGELKAFLGVSKPHEISEREYVMSIALLSAALAAAAFFISGRLAIGLLALIPLSETAAALVNHLCVRKTESRILPKIEQRGALDKKTLVVTTSLIDSPAGVEKLLRKMEVMSAGNCEEGLFFGVLADFKDAKTQNAENDAPLADFARERLQQLNGRGKNKFFFFIRKRRLNPLHNCFMGWERKRGALLELARLLRRGGDKSFLEVMGAAALPDDIQYIITLDSDTELAPDSARRLVGAMLHPLVNPEINEKARDRAQGRTFITPNVRTDLESSNVSFFTKLFSPFSGVESYQGAAHNVYQDLFKRAIFTGKGIFDIDSFLSHLDGEFPENAILSHDLIEGETGGCALAEDIDVFDGFPKNYLAYSARGERWTRGDWQLLLRLAPNVYRTDGKKYKNTLGFLSRYKVFDNLRRSMVLPFCLLLLFCAFVLENVCALSVVILVLATPLIFTLFSGKHARKSSELRAESAISPLQGELFRFSCSFMLLPHAGITAVKAAARALLRIRSGKNALEWVTAADAEKCGRSTVRAYYCKMAETPVLAALLLAVSAIREPLWSLTGLLLFMLWIFAPAYMYIISQPYPVGNRIGKKSESFLFDVAQKTWSYFEKTVTGEEHFLPPDNFQEDPPNGVAPRTSPTNMGLYLLAALSAADLGFISPQEMEKKIDDTIRSLQILPKWKGHFFNWYDTRTLAPLYPRYVSTVDSGNLAGYLITLKEGLKEKGSSPELIAKIEALVFAMDFRPLYDGDRQLFSIGMNIENGELTNSFYDLLASEARQTSYLAIALGYVEQKHWRRLSRTLKKSGGRAGLASWTGTIFEYLMPDLIMKKFGGSILSESSSFAVETQRRYGEERGVLWGNSESGFYEFDINSNYQYRAFGTPDLSLKRGMEKDVVIAPYASVMSLTVNLGAAIGNLSKLKKMGVLGPMGFYEAVDYTPKRQEENGSYRIVKSYMAHHQGMCMLALNNILSDNILVRRFHSEPKMAAFELLLQERFPTRAVVLRSEKEKTPPRRIVPERDFSRTFNGDYGAHGINRGLYNIFIDTNGRGYYKRKKVSLGRFYPLYGEKSGDRVYADQKEIAWTSANFLSNKIRLHARGERAGISREICLAAQSGARIEKICADVRDPGVRIPEITAYCELSLNEPERDIAHTAFSNLFLQTEIFPDKNAIIASRRPRENAEEEMFGLYMITGGRDVRLTTDRASFIGRGNTLEKPAFDMENRAGRSPLEPCCAARFFLSDEKEPCAYIVSYISKSRARVEEVMEKYAWRAECENELKNHSPGGFFGEKMSRKQLETAFDLMPLLLYGDLREKREDEPYTESDEGLWRLGLSGDLPIVTVHLWEEEHIEKLETMLKCHELWRVLGCECDLVALCDDRASYIEPLCDMAREEIMRSPLKNMCEVRGGVHLKNGKTLSQNDRRLIKAASAAYIEGEKDAPQKELLFPRATAAKEDLSPAGELPALAFSNGVGGFDQEKNEYVIRTAKNRQTPMPWINVVSNPDFGFWITERGVGFTWAHNSRENKLTPWHSDPIVEKKGERLYCAKGGEVWDMLSGDILCRHGMGYSAFETRHGDISQEIVWFVPKDRMMKIGIVTLTGESGGEIELRFEADALLGSERAKSARLLVKDNNTATLGDKKMYISFDGDFESGDFSVRKKAPLAAGQKISAVVCLGYGEPESVSLDDALKMLEDVKAFWAGFLTQIEVKTPSPAVDTMLNQRLLYQTLSCRMWARSAFYQCGGAYGFRDQLQDCGALFNAAPDIAREQILLHAAHQFEEGDVLHWWHEMKGCADKGVRTRISDDRLWLPYIAADYVRTAGDQKIMEEKIPYLHAAPLEKNEHERYFEPHPGSIVTTLYEHCRRAIDISLKKGPHGLLLMGGGDWNDAMNEVGKDGQGESVWLTLFMIKTLEIFIPLCDEKDKTRYGAEREKLIGAVENHAWEGDRYLRAFFDCGLPLGSKTSESCKIDAVSQSWAAIALGGNARTRRALETLDENLVSKEHKIIKLLEPPFDGQKQRAGYINGYIAGVRENGGQYTHAGAWAALANAEVKNKDRALAYFEMLLPISHAFDPQGVSVYKTEPYAVAADVYSAPPHEGRGGWSWYTGAAAWLYRVGIEHILGLKKRGETLVIAPCVPGEWGSFEVRYRYMDTLYIIKADRAKGERITEIALENDQKTHTVEVLLD